MTQRSLGFMDDMPDPITTGDGRAAPESLSADLQTILSSKNKNWCTPPNVLKPARAFADLYGGLGLDPCSNPSSQVAARVEWSLENGDDGLIEAWAPHPGVTWMNPPFGEDEERGTSIGNWVEKALYEHRCGAEILGLVPAYVGAVWFQEHCAPPNASVCFWRGRIKFLGAEHGCTFSTAIIYWGVHVEQFARIFRPYGKLWLAAG